MPLKYLAAHDGRWAGDQGPQAAAAEGVAAAQDGRWAAKQGPEGEGCWSPDAFVPERMLTPQGQKTGDLMPFGYGARWGQWCVYGVAVFGWRQRETGVCSPARCRHTMHTTAEHFLYTLTTNNQTEQDSPHLSMTPLTSHEHFMPHAKPCPWLNRYCLGSGLAMAEMKVLLALLARHYSYTAYNATEWVHTISKVPKVCEAWVFGGALQFQTD